MVRKFLSVCLLAWILAALPLTAMAQDFDPHQPGSISVTLVSRDGTEPMEGAQLSLFHVATVGADENGTLFYAYTDAFSHCGAELNDPELVKTLDTFVSERNIPAETIVTDAQGKAICQDLPLGLYFVKQTGTVEGFAPCPSFLVTLPMKTDSGFRYDVDASPKTDVEKLVSITIRKVWNTDKSTAVPESVTVQLLRYEEVVQTATLSEENDWQVTYTGLPESDGYHIKEVNIPKGFTATYTQNGYTFTATNTASLAQTGQRIWPIPVLAMAGIFFLLTGTAILRKPEKHNA
jgi:hypothetical protein